MDLVATIWDAAKCLCNCTAKHVAFISHLEDNLHSLTNRWTELQNRSQDVKSMVQQAESRPHMRRTREVDGWLQTVNDFEKKIEDIQERGAKVVQDKCLGKFCNKNCLSNYDLGKEVDEALDRLRELMVKGENFNDNVRIASEQQHEPAEEMPMPKTVGMDLMLRKVWDSIEEENVGIVGLYGMGGAGKTTLMKKVNNEFARRSHDFDMVIWVVVSKDRSVDKIVDDICKSAHIFTMNESIDDKTREIYNMLKHKKFVLLLDDIWEGLDLDSIGVPPPNERNKSKVLFTTRLESVCDQMQAKKFEVKCLTKEDAFDLFCMKVGEETINAEPTIRELARELIEECKGLPLALIIIGRAMAGRKNPQSWNHAIKLLKSCPSKVKGMEHEVFFILKYSYDSLPTATEKSCFLYLAMFPEDKIISILDLIHLWIGEGLLGKHGNIHDAFNQGHNIVETLKLACLVEEVYEGSSIKVHDVIRDMALWLLCDQDQTKNKILVEGDKALKSLQVDYLENWEIVEKISIMTNTVLLLQESTSIKTWNLPVCPQLVTLIVRCNVRINNLENIQFMSKLKVLSLKGIVGYTDLLAKIGQLIHLEFLELSECIRIKEKLPMEMKNLKRLKVFIVEDINCGVQFIPLEVISCLESLRLFKLNSEGVMEDIEGIARLAKITDAEEELFLEKLELLPHLEDISITLGTPSGLNKLLRSANLQRCVRYVGTNQSGRTAIDTAIILIVAKLECLECMELVNLPNSLEVSLVNHTDKFCKLRKVVICQCNSITHLTWLNYAPHLRTLSVQSCDRLEEVITETIDNGYQNKDGIFSNLESLTLSILPELRSICKNSLSFPKLQYMLIGECPCLKKLPLDLNSAKYLKEIKGQKKWWDNLEWEHPTIEELFHTKFINEGWDVYCGPLWYARPDQYDYWYNQYMNAYYGFSD